MKAYLTYIRKNENEIHFIGIENPKNSFSLGKLNLISGQPVLCVVQEHQIVAFYILSNSGELFQIKGDLDVLFGMKEIQDHSTMNVKKYNAIKYFLCNTFSCISLKEFSLHKKLLENLENKIFYNYLHTDFEISKLKTIIMREINRSDLNVNLKKRLIESVKKSRNPTKKILKKKVDINLSGYGIYINTFVP
jgi:hypothetical protein